MVIKKNYKKKVKLNLQQKQTLKDELKQKKLTQISMSNTPPTYESKIIL